MSNAMKTVVAAGFVSVLCVSVARAEPPTMINYQGTVKINGSGYGGTGHFKFAIVDSGDTTSYWTNAADVAPNDGEPDAAVSLTVSNGLFNVLLGDTSPTGMDNAVTGDVFDQTDTFLKVWFSQSGDAGSFQALAPNQRIASVGYAMVAKSVSDSVTLTGDVTMPGTGVWESSGDVGIGTTDPDEKLEVNGVIKSNGLYSLEGRVTIGPSATEDLFIPPVGGDPGWSAWLVTAQSSTGSGFSGVCLVSVNNPNAPVNFYINDLGSGSYVTFSRNSNNGAVRMTNNHTASSREVHWTATKLGSGRAL